MKNDPEQCATCHEVEVDREGDDCRRQHAEDQHWDNRMDWEREKELLED